MNLPFWKSGATVVPAGPRETLLKRNGPLELGALVLASRSLSNGSMVSGCPAKPTTRSSCGLGPSLASGGSTLTVTVPRTGSARPSETSTSIVFVPDDTFASTNVTNPSGVNRIESGALVDAADSTNG